MWLNRTTEHGYVRTQLSNRAISVFWYLRGIRTRVFQNVPDAHVFIPIAWALFEFNLALLLVGGAQWGTLVMGIGTFGTLALVTYQFLAVFKFPVFL